MNSKKFDISDYKDKFLFLPLGGAGEIGMNLNLYYHEGKWIMVDLGIGFSGATLPGIDIIVPNINFIIEHIKDDLLGIIITHAHEDHIGAVQYLWPELNVPVYTSKFSASILRSKCKEYGFLDRMKIIEKDIEKPFSLGGFELEFVNITHSVPEMNALYIKTSKGNIFHTGDWKFDNDPVVGRITNTDKLKAIGQDNVLALVGDSTNVFHKNHSGSEGELALNLKKVIKEHSKGLVIVTTFASNVARLHSIGVAAKEAGKKLVLLGRSLWRIYTAAKESGYLQDFIAYGEKEIDKFKRKDLLILCTGCQGEDRAVMNKLATKSYQYLNLKSDDVVIFSSKIIPGNERRIYDLMNKLSDLGVHILNEHNEFVHVSGHPSSIEVSQMYEYIKPKIAIPVHGESMHLLEHADLAKRVGVPKALIVKNGDVVNLDFESLSKIGNVESGYFAIDGNMILDSNSDVISERRVLAENGGIFITALMGKKRIAKIIVNAPGILEKKYDSETYDQIEGKVRELITSSNYNTSKKSKIIIERTVLRFVSNLLGKKPLVRFEVIEI